MQTTTWMDTQEKSKKRRNSAFKLHLLGNANSYQNPFTKKQDMLHISIRRTITKIRKQRAFDKAIKVKRLEVRIKYVKVLEISYVT